MEIKKTKYFLKLINGEKFQITESEFNTYIHNPVCDYIVLNSVNNNPIYIMKSNILLAFKLLPNKNFDDTKGKCIDVEN